jgi:diguanylate cyclase (GGDEF)-like protein/putative nucleotidyltransferase with HDIG domain
MRDVVDSVVRGSYASLNRLLEPAAPGPVKWRSLAWLYALAGVSAFGTLIAGIDTEVDPGLIAALASVALAAAALMYQLAPRIPGWCLLPALSLGLVLVSAAVIASGEADSPYSLIYIWVGAEAWFFLRARAAVALTLATIALSALVMLRLSPETGDTDAAAWWVMVTGSLVAISSLAAVLHGRAVRLIGRLAEAAVRDPLTGLLNRRGYQERLATELEQARRADAPLSIVLGDLDAFKTLNDRLGHRHGDDALRRFADVCQSHLRGKDFIARVGGEEFAIVLPETSERDAVLIAERLRRAVAGELRAGDGARITASFGVAAFPQHGGNAEMLLDHADQAMYAAKSMGRDRTVAFGPDLTRSLAGPAHQEHLQAVLMLAETLDLRDAATHTHSETVAGLCEQMASGLGLDSGRVERIRLAGLLHDIGKIGVADSILRKPGALDRLEWEEMRQHPELGARIVRGAGLADVADWVLAHHERPDGRGYPYGLEGAQIPVEARILAIADAYEAMTADRPYRDGMSQEEAWAELERCAGTQFDPDLVEIFLAARAQPSTPVSE